MQLDPLTGMYPDLSPYNYGGNDPIGNVDEDGLSLADPLKAGKIIIGADGVMQGSSEVVVTAVRHVTKASSSILSVSGSFVKGVGQSLWSTVTGVVQAVGHPIQTATALANVVAHPVQTAHALVSVAKTAYKEFKNGNADTRANMLGNAIGDVAQLFIGTEEIKAASEAVTVAKDVGEVEELGIVYERLNLKTGERYVGQAKSESRFLERQAEHDRELGIKHKYNELGRAKPGKDLDVLEETHIRQGGGPKNKGGKLANKRYQMNEMKYKKAGGTAIKPTR